MRRDLYDTPLPDGWVELPLRAVSRRRRGYSWSKEQESLTPSADNIPVVRIPNVQDRLDLSELLFLRDVAEEDVASCAVEKDWILYVASNGNPDRIGDSVLIDRDMQMLVASFLQAITSRDQEQLNPAFLAEWLRLHQVHQTFSKTSQQTTGLANFSWSAVKNLPVRFPVDMDEQVQVVRALESIRQAQEANKTEQSAAEQLKRTLLEELFAQGIQGSGRESSETKWLRCPADWQRIPLRKLASVDSGFTMGRDLGASEIVTVPYVTVVNVQDGWLDLDEVSRAEIKSSELKTGLLQHGDVLMTEGGDRDKLGRGCIWSGEIPDCAFQNHIFRVRLDNEQYRPKLFHYLIQTQQSKRYFASHAKQTSNLCTINSRELNRFQIGVPEMNEQDAMVMELERADALIAAIEREADALGQLELSTREAMLGGHMSLAGAIGG